MESLSTMLEHSREENHPSRTTWDLFLLDSLSAPEQATLEDHLGDCSHCEQQLDELKAERAHFVETMDVDKFLSRITSLAAASTHVEVEAAADELVTSGAFAPSVQGLRENINEGRLHLETSQVVERQKLEQEEPTETVWSQLNSMFRQLLRPVVWAPIGACTLLLMFVFQSNNILNNENPKPAACLTLDTPENGVRRKGNPEMQVFLFRDGKRTLAKSKGLYKAGDILALRYKSMEFRYLSVVYVDNKGELGWLYPQQPGPSIPVASQGDLKDSVQLDQAKGKERLLAFFSRKPLQANDVRRLVRKKLQTGYLAESCQLSNLTFLHELVLLKR